MFRFTSNMVENLNESASAFRQIPRELNSKRKLLIAHDLNNKRRNDMFNNIPFKAKTSPNEMRLFLINNTTHKYD